MTGERVPILYLAPWVDLGGSDKGTIDWFRHIDRGRWAPSLITTQPSPNRWLRQVEPHAEEVWELPDLMPGASFPEFILGFIESRGVEIVHIMNSRLGFDLLPDMTCLPRPPAIVVQMHAEEPNRAGYVRYVTRRYGNLIDAFSVTSDHLKATVAGYEIPPSRIEVIHSGVDGEVEFNPEVVEPLRLKGNGAPRVLWPGRLVEQKDPFLTMDVLARARGRGAEFVLDVVGDGHMETAVKARARQLGVADLVHWHPPSQEMARWYRSADLLLMTSVFEGIPYAIYESLAMGVPVVAPSLPGNAEFMDADSGALIEPRGDADGYAEAIVELLGDGDRRREMGIRSRERMLDEFSLEEMGRRHDELYGTLLAARPVSSHRRGDALAGGEEACCDRQATGPAAALGMPRDPLPERSIGVIVPCYRHGIFLDECIGSIKAQTLAPARIVVVDDGSDDLESIEALEALERDPDLTVVRQPLNSGPSAARNRALEGLDTSYVLPIDADDRLLPDALERMLAQLESAPEDVGFVYPHAQHIGNRCDYIQLPAYNLWLLMEENYCPAPSLFDRRVFQRGDLRYAEEIVVGHEDWDLVLQLAERGIRGQHADGPTFLYRRQGFSRVNAVDYGPHTFHDAIKRRHPSLYLDRDRIKAEWAPALSIVLIDGEAGDWSDLAGPALSPQTCRDFEVLGRTGLGDGIRAVECGGGTPEEWLQAAIRKARGPRVCLLTPAAASLLEDTSFVEQLLYGFLMPGPVAAIVFASAPGGERHNLAQLDDRERIGARPLGIAFERPPTAPIPPVGLTGGARVLDELAAGLQANGPVQWRAVSGADPSEGRREAISPSLDEPLRLELDHEWPADRSEQLTRQATARQSPRLPELTPGTVRRWEDAPGWTPPETQHLCRHVELEGEGRMISNDRNSPLGYALEFDLGVTRLSAAPGMRRLLHSAGSFETTDDQNDLGRGREGLGYLEDQPLPMLEPLELRRISETGQMVLVAGPHDPLFGTAEPVATLGWIECFPLAPRGGSAHTGPWGAALLQRQVDGSGWRHRYLVSETPEPAAELTLGSLFTRPGEGRTALRMRADGRLVSDLGRPGRASRDPRKVLRWLAARPHPEERPGSARLARARHLAGNFSARRLAGDAGVTLGWLRTEGAAACNLLFSASHPATGDQLLTCSPPEALAHGYLLDAELGFVLDAGSSRMPSAGR